MIIWKRNVEECKGKNIFNILQFKSGQSNPTYLLKHSNGKDYVLRKKPPGKLLQSAHMIEREYKIMSVLFKANFPVPEILIFCEDSSVIGTSFYIMRFIKGRIFRDITLPDMNKQERKEIYDELYRVLAQLHSIDHKKYGLEKILERMDHFIPDKLQLGRGNMLIQRQVIFNQWRILCNFFQKIFQRKVKC